MVVNYLSDVFQTIHKDIGYFPKKQTRTELPAAFWQLKDFSLWKNGRMAQTKTEIYRIAAIRRKWLRYEKKLEGYLNMDLESLDQDGDKDLLLEIDDTIGRFILDTYRDWDSLTDCGATDALLEKYLKWEERIKTIYLEVWNRADPDEVIFSWIKRQEDEDME